MPESAVLVLEGGVVGDAFCGSAAVKIDLDAQWRARRVGRQASGDLTCYLVLPACLSLVCAARYVRVYRYSTAISDMDMR